MSRHGCSTSTTHSTRPTATSSPRSTPAWAISSPTASASRTKRRNACARPITINMAPRSGLMRLHDVCPNAFLDYVHDIDLSVIAPAPELRDALDALPGRKFVFTNGSRKHAESVISRLGLD